jgi:hypothetical protein
LSDPSLASDDDELKPVVKSSNLPSKPARPWQKNLKQDSATSKARAVSSIFYDEEDEDGIIVGAVGKPAAASRKAHDEDDAPIKSKKERSGTVKNDTEKKRVPSGAKSKSKAPIHHDEEEPETFNLNGIHASDSESPDDHVLKVKNKDDKVKAKKKAATAEKPKPEARRADKAAGTSTAVVAANDAPARPKKRTMNLLGGVLGGTGTGALGDWWNTVRSYYHARSAHGTHPYHFRLRFPIRTEYRPFYRHLKSLLRRMFHELDSSLERVIRYQLS